MTCNCQRGSDNSKSLYSLTLLFIVPHPHLDGYALQERQPISIGELRARTITNDVLEFLNCLKSLPTVCQVRLPVGTNWREKAKSAMILNIKELTAQRAGQAEKGHNKLCINVEPKGTDLMGRGGQGPRSPGPGLGAKRCPFQMLIPAATTFSSGQTYTTGPLSGLFT